MKKKLITAAVLAGIAGTSNAVNVNPDGLGQVAIYPYYTVNGNFDTLISVVNTTNQVKAVKVRFLEGKNSREVLDFNLYLSPFDVWTGAIIAEGEGAALTTADTSCTVPKLEGMGNVPFRNFEYVDDPEDDSLARTREGHIELIEMGVVTNAPGFPFATAATHVNGVPPNCDLLVNAWAEGGEWDITQGATGVSAPTGGLFGNAVIVTVDNGTAGSYTATALDDFLIREFHTDPGDTFPSLNNAAPPVSRVFDNGNFIQTFWGFTSPGEVNPNAGVDATSAVLMHNSVLNEFVLDNVTNAVSSWVVTFPTKRFYVDPELVGLNPINPFTSIFELGGACEDVDLQLWNREETASGAGAGVDFSPLPPQGRNVLCWESNVITFNEGNPLNSQLTQNLETDFENGWMQLSFNNDGNVLVSPALNVADPSLENIPFAEHLYFGLPAVGFLVTNHQNGSLTIDGESFLANYGLLFNHRFTRNIVVSS